jgi:hypothetical protein
VGVCSAAETVFQRDLRRVSVLARLVTDAICTIRECTRLNPSPRTSFILRVSLKTFALSWWPTLTARSRSRFRIFFPGGVLVSQRPMTGVLVFNLAANCCCDSPRNLRKLTIANDSMLFSLVVGRGIWLLLWLCS